MSILLAFAAAAFNAASNVLQRRANLEAPAQERFSVRLLGHLLRRGSWLAGIGAVMVSFILQAAALASGELALVQPIIILELPLTLVAATRFLHRPMQHGEWAATAVLTAGVAGLLAFLEPRAPTTPSPGAGTWLVGLAVTYGAVVALVLAGSRLHGGRRAALYGAATGVEFGVTAALMKEMTNAFAAGGIDGTLTSWATYTMVASGLIGVLLLQNALQAGPLVAAQPGITLLDPLTAVLWGVFGFGERLNGGWLVVGAGASALALAWGALRLARSPGLSDDDPVAERPPDERTHPAPT